AASRTPRPIPSSRPRTDARSSPSRSCIRLAPRSRPERGEVRHRGDGRKLRDQDLEGAEDHSESPREVKAMNSNRDPLMQAASDEARRGLAEGGIPIGSVLAIDGRVVGRGHNRRVQRGSAILHAEMDAFENAGRLQAGEYRRAVLYSTLSPCAMCSGAA